MKNFITAITFLLSMVICQLSFADGIDFIHDKKFEEVLALAKAQNKLVFIDCYTSWCGPCKRLAATVFPDATVGEYFNANFVNSKFDMEKDADGPSIAAKYSIRAYPTLLWLDGNGTVIHKLVGGTDATGLIAQGKKAIDPTPGILGGMKEQYKNGTRDVVFLSDFLNTLNSSEEKYDDIFKEYLTKLSPNDFTDKKHSQTIFNLTKDLKSPGLPYLMKNKEYYQNLMTVAVFNKRINQIADKAVSEAPKADDAALFHGALDLIKSNKALDAAQKTLQLSMEYYSRMNDWVNYDKNASQYIKKYASKNAKDINDIAWAYFLNVNDEAQLQKATKWAYTAINTDNKYTYNLTYAYLLYKQNIYKEAERACDYAIIRAKEENITPTSATALKDAIIKSLAKQ